MAEDPGNPNPLDKEPDPKPEPCTHGGGLDSNCAYCMAVNYPESDWRAKFGFEVKAEAKPESEAPAEQGEKFTTVATSRRVN